MHTSNKNGQASDVNFGKSRLIEATASDALGGSLRHLPLQRQGDIQVLPEHLSNFKIQRLGLET